MLLDLLSCVPRQIQCQSFAVPVGDCKAATSQQHCVAFIEPRFLECAWSVPQCARVSGPVVPCCVRQRYVVSEQKLTWTIESHSRMLARNLLPRPSPVLAPLTRPAMSTNSMLVGTSFFDFDRSLNICGHGRLCCCICSIHISADQGVAYLQSVIWNSNHANVRFNGAKWKICCLCFCVFADGVEQG